MTYVPAKFEVTTSNGLRDALHLLRPWGQSHTNVAQYPLHYVTYSATKFEVATSNGLGGDTFTRNVTGNVGTKFI